MERGVFDDPHYVNNYLQIFIAFLFIAGVIIFMLIIGLENNLGAINEVFFGVFPYVALAIFIPGEVRRTI